MDLPTRSVVPQIIKSPLISNSGDANGCETLVILVKPPKYSIIIVNFNGGPLIMKCLDSVFQHTSDFELILVDNNSTDQSAAEAIRRYPQITLLKNQRNLGFAAANNVGIGKSRGSWIVLLNPDTIATNGWVESLGRCSAVSEIGIAGPKLLRMDGRTIDSTGIVFNFKSGLSYDRGSGETDLGQFDKPESVSCLSFACAAIRREVIDTVGLLDEKMVLYFDDIDYCVRALIAGWRVMYCPNSVVLHARGGVTPKSFTRAQRQAVAFRLRIMLKCYNLHNAMRYGFLRIANDVVSSIAGLKNNDFEYFRGYLRSPFWNLLNIPIGERKRVQSSRRIPDHAFFSA
jgi:GT2 family glycosyltransferase